MTAPRTDYRIRPATELDIAALLKCLSEAFEPYRHQYTIKAYVDTVLTDRTARARLRSMAVRVAEDASGAIVGTISWSRVSETEGHLRGMAVLPDWQGTGVAGGLLRTALEHLTGAGCRRVTLDTTLPLLKATRFYEKNGFRKSGKTSAFFGMPLIEYVRELG
jgi:predicted N-acetyltransferase YhbS